jgi:hypothetical protein
MHTIRHIHQRDFAVPGSRIRPLVGALWSATPLDAFPWDCVRTFRRDPVGAGSFVERQSHFGHGPFRFVVDKWDDAQLRAIIETPGIRGFHAFELHPLGEGTRLIHRLEAEVELRMWFVWRLAIGAAHDWAVEATFDRLQYILDEGHCPARTMRRAPAAMRLIAAARRLRKASPAARQRRDVVSGDCLAIRPGSGPAGAKDSDEGDA